VSDFEVIPSFWDSFLFSKGGLVDVANIDTVLQSMDMQFTEEEIDTFMEKVPIDGEYVHLIVPVRHIWGCVHVDIVNSGKESFH
jgi:hypothetical protein